MQFLSLAEGKHEVDTHEVDKDNVPHWFRNTVWGFTERGCLVAAFGRQVDITEQKEIQRERYKLLNSLAAQQKKLMQLIGLHENIKLIADKLNFTEKTVSTERDRLKRKFNLSHTDDLRPLAWQRGFIPTDLNGLRFALLSGDDATEIP